MNAQPNSNLNMPGGAGAGDGRSGVSNPLAKLGIGALAAAVAFLAPILMPVVTRQDLSQVLPWLANANTFPILVLSFCVVLWCLVVGTIVMLIEWKESNPPGQTFFRALGLPAVIAGLVVSSQQAAVNESQAALSQQQVQELKVEQSDLRRKLLQAIDVPVSAPLPLDLFAEPEPPAEGTPPSSPTGPQGSRGSWIDQVWPGGVALAQSEKAPETKGTAGPRYAIILHRAGTESAAKRYIEENKSTLKTLRVIRMPLPEGKSGYLVAYSGPLSEKEAFEAAIALKQQGYNPEVVPLK